MGAERMTTTVRRTRAMAATVATALLVAAAPAASQLPDAPAGGPASERAEGRGGMVAAAHPLAVEAGREVLREGGNSVDAAVATALVLGVVEPMMAGVGGGGSLTLWMEEEARADHVEFYASAGADPDYRLDSLHWPAPPERQVAVPGTVQGLWQAHRRYGELPWERLVEPAIRVAREGFTVHTLLARVIEEQREKLTRTPEVGRVFYPEGSPLQAGDRLVQGELARTLEAIARQGRDGFYRGDVAGAVVDRLSRGGSPLVTSDFAGFEARWRRPVCGSYRDHTVIAAPPPMAGVEVVETLRLLEGFDLGIAGPPAEDPASLARVVDAIRLARADRAAWIGAPERVEVGVPAVRLTSDAYLRHRRSLMTGAEAPEEVEAGDPWADGAPELGTACRALDALAPTDRPRPADESRPMEELEPDDEGQTSHFSIVDGEGNAASMTFTMGFYFGSGVYVEGFFLNSAALNFGGPEANRRGPGRAPRSSTAPTIVLDGDDVRLVVGSPGSGRIPPAIVHTVLYTLDFGLDPREALAMPRVYPAVGEPSVRLESGFAPAALSGLRGRGYRLSPEPPYDLYFGGVHAVLVREDGTLVGAADPRRDGAAAGY